MEFTEHKAFIATQGGLDDGLELDFEDSDAVLYVPPPTYDDAVDSIDHASLAAEKVKAALQMSETVQRLIVLSALGAQHSSGIVGVPPAAKLAGCLGNSEHQSYDRRDSCAGRA